TYLLTYLLIALMIMSVMPATVFAADKQIKSVNVTGYEAPRPGRTPDFDGYATSTAGGFHVDKTSGVNKSGAQWYDRTDKKWMTTTSTFVEGHEYSLTVFLAADDGYVFVKGSTAPDFTAYIDGGAAETSYTSDDKTKFAAINRVYVCEYGMIDLIEVFNVTTPKPGRTPSFYAETKAYTYTIADELGTDGVLWWDVTNEKYMTKSDTFVGGREYTARVHVKAITGYRFSTSYSVLKTKVNGVDSNSTWAIISGKDKYTYRQIGYKFTCEAETVSKVEIKDVVYPVHGESPVFSGTVTSIGSKIVSLQGTTNGYSWYDVTNAKYMTASDKFVAGHEYIYGAYVGRQTGYEYAAPENMSVTIASDINTVYDAKAGYLSGGGVVYRYVYKTYVCDYDAEFKIVQVKPRTVPEGEVVKSVKDGKIIVVEGLTPNMSYDLEFFISTPPSGLKYKGIWVVEGQSDNTTIKPETFQPGQYNTKYWSTIVAGNPGDEAKAVLNIYALKADGTPVTGIPSTFDVILRFADPYNEQKGDIHSGVTVDGTTYTTNPTTIRDTALFEKHEMEFVIDIPKDIKNAGYGIGKVKIQDHGKTGTTDMEPVFDEKTGIYTVKYDFIQEKNVASRTIDCHVYLKNPGGTIMGNPVTNRVTFTFKTLDTSMELLLNGKALGKGTTKVTAESFEKQEFEFIYKMPQAVLDAGYVAAPYAKKTDADGNVLYDVSLELQVTESEDGKYHCKRTETGAYGEEFTYTFYIKLRKGSEEVSLDSVAAYVKFEGTKHLNFYATAIDGNEYPGSDATAEVKSNEKHNVDVMIFVSDEFAALTKYDFAVMEQGVTPFMQETTVTSDKFVFVKDVAADTVLGTPAGKVYKYSVDTGVQAKDFVYERNFTLGFVKDSRFTEIDVNTVKVKFTDKQTEITDATFDNVFTGVYVDDQEVDANSTNNVTGGEHTVQFNWEMPVEASAQGYTLKPIYTKFVGGTGSADGVTATEYQSGKFYFKKTVSGSEETVKYMLRFDLYKNGTKVRSLPQEVAVTLTYAKSEGEITPDAPTISDIHEYATVDIIDVGINPAAVEVEAGDHVVEFLFNNPPFVPGYYVEFKIKIGDAEAKYINPTFENGIMSYKETISVAEGKTETVSLIAYLCGAAGEVIEESSNTVILKNTPAPVTPLTYEITFDANGGTGTMESVKVEFGKDFTVPECGFTAPEGKEFKVWHILDGVEYNPGETINITDTSVTFICLSAVWTPKETPGPGEETYLLGDVNKDGKINALDATQILRYANNKSSVIASMSEEEAKGRADVNKDGKINALDATQILRYANNKSSVLKK
ncbi:MAG: hypothetical protein IKM61_05375, partial [Eubacteriaceae bacterium]|nr:hypothetical protein [Eubacteriaceae bacterium]